MTLLTSQSDCGFPSYDFSPTAGSGGTGGPSGGAGSGGTGALGGASAGSGNSGDDSGAGVGAGANAGASGAGAAGAAGDAGASGSGPGCSYPAPVVYPDHCVDNAAGANETGLDCGGPDCLPCETNQPCVQDSDCASGTCTKVSNVCTQVLSLRYMAVVAQSFTIGPKFRLVIDYKDTKTTLLSSLRIRYYFNHNGVAEPVIALDTQATINSGTTMDISDKVNAQVFRLPPGLPAQKGGQITDSYLEISFSSALQLGAGTSLDLTADIVAANPDVPFQQSSHYSFRNVGGLAATDTITVFRDQIRVWGMEPPLSRLPDCAFAGGVNLGGPSVTLGSSAEQGPTLAGSDGNEDLTFSGSTYASPTSKPLPWADANSTKMLSSAFIFTSADTATWNVPDGAYWLYAWLTSGASADSGTLSAEGAPLDIFYGVQRNSSSGWARLGPYPISVTDQALHLTASGKVNVAGLELYLREP